MEEEWKDIKGYEGLYQISSYGRVMSLRTDKIMIPHLRGGNYFAVGLRKDGKQISYSIHSMVAVAFLGHERCGHKLVVNHKDGNRHNNVRWNLDIMTNRENTSDGYRRKGVTSIHAGVSYDRFTKKWRARIYDENKNKHLGRFGTENEAHLAYQNYLQTIKQYQLC